MMFPCSLFLGQPEEDVQPDVDAVSIYLGFNELMT